MLNMPAAQTLKSLVVACLTTLLVSVAAAQERADLVLFNGRVFTSDDSKAWAEAIAIRGDRIVAVGANGDVLRLAGDGTKRIDLHGHLVIPGINDADARFEPGPQSFVVATTSNSTADDVIVAIAAATDETPGDLWIAATIGERALRDPRLTVAALDKVAGGRKVVLMSAAGHACVFSRAALAALRIGDTGPDPAGGSFERDSNGHVTGKAFEYACFNAKRALSETISDADAVDALRAVASKALSYGITTLQSTSSLPMTRFEKVVRHAEVPVRIRMIHTPGTDANGRDLTREDAGPARNPERGLTVISGTKWVLDGTAGDERAALRRPYHSGSDRSGDFDFPPAEISKILSESLASHDQLMLHVDGDRTAAALFDTMKSLPSVDWKSKRVALEHGDGLTANLLPAAQSLGVVVVQNPTQLASASAYPVAEYVPLKSLLRARIPLAFGSGADFNPFRGMALASTFPERRPEAISRQEALEAYTRGSAFAEFAEKDKGIIAAGKLADLAVLSQDVFKAPLADLADTVSLLTIVDGKIVYQGAPLAPPEPSKSRLSPH